MLGTDVCRFFDLRLFDLRASFSQAADLPSAMLPFNKAQKDSKRTRQRLLVTRKSLSRFIRTFSTLVLPSSINSVLKSFSILPRDVTENFITFHKVRCVITDKQSI